MQPSKSPFVMNMQQKRSDEAQGRRKQTRPNSPASNAQAASVAPQPSSSGTGDAPVMEADGRFPPAQRQGLQHSGRGSQQYGRGSQKSGRGQRGRGAQGRGSQRLTGRSVPSIGADGERTWRGTARGAEEGSSDRDAASRQDGRGSWQDDAGSHRSGSGSLASGIDRDAGPGGAERDPRGVFWGGPQDERETASSRLNHSRVGHSAELRNYSISQESAAAPGIFGDQDFYAPQPSSDMAGSLQMGRRGDDIGWEGEEAGWADGRSSRIDLPVAIR
jgi:hypothetical protein